jgi:tetratricopeptide (TPR) repeat protein
VVRGHGDVYQYVIYNSFEACALLHLGAWREMQAHLKEAVEITEKNANRQISCLPRLMIGWLHIEAMDFAGANQICRDALDPEVEENPVNFFLGRNLIAKASLGLSDLSTAREQFEEIEHRIEVDATPMDSIFYPLLYQTRCEYFLRLGDLGRAREQAALCYDAPRLPPERTYLALAHTLFVKIAMAGGNFEETRGALSKAVAAVGQEKLPLAAWRVYATVAEFYASAGEAEMSAAYRRRSDTAVRFLVHAFDQDDPLRASLIAACVGAIHSETHV